MTKHDFSDDTFLPVRMIWSKKYAMPIFIVGDSEHNDGGIRHYAPATGEYAGYFDDITEADPEASTEAAA